MRDLRSIGKASPWSSRRSSSLAGELEPVRDQEALVASDIGMHDVFGSGGWARQAARPGSKEEREPE